MVRDWFEKCDENKMVTVASVHQQLSTQGHHMPLPTALVNSEPNGFDLKFAGDSLAASLMAATNSQAQSFLCKPLAEGSSDNSSSGDYLKPNKIRRPGAQAPLRHIKNALTRCDEQVDPDKDVGGVDSTSCKMSKAQMRQVARRGGADEKANKFVRPRVPGKEEVDKEKKKPTAWALFNTEIRAGLKKDKPLLTLGELSRIVGERWSNLSKTETDKWNKKADGEDSDEEEEEEEEEESEDEDDENEEDENEDEDFETLNGKEVKSSKKRKGRKPAESTTTKVAPEASSDDEGNFDNEAQEERDDDDPEEWHALPAEIKDREMEVFWVRYSSKVSHPSSQID